MKLALRKRAFGCSCVRRAESVVNMSGHVGRACRDLRARLRHRSRAPQEQPCRTIEPGLPDELLIILSLIHISEPTRLALI
eukprot:11231269-Alexandrium_andersonii.AAC.1